MSFLTKHDFLILNTEEIGVEDVYGELLTKDNFAKLN